ncbi:MAG: serine/threonine protein kinase, partial [Myxococcales bacterium]|nr:serine/threonine protein kinase [Myxococcales bacterium]
MKQRCLDDSTIDAYLHARLREDERAAAEAHVDACPECSAVVSVLAGGTPLAHATEAGPAPGDRVGRYVVVGALGEGAMGVVYAAHDPELDRKVALKLLRPGSAPGAGERMQREAQAMARIAHPNVVAIHDVGRFQGAVYLAMEHVVGATLRGWCAAAERTREARLAVMLEAGRGLAAAHAAGLVHRDFKPENVLVGDDGRARVTDFGLARLGAPSADAALDAGESLELTRAGALVGTPAYLAPELWAGGAATPASDQLAFAVTLHEVLFGVRPFAGRTAAELRAALERGPTLAADAGDLAPSFARALARDPSARVPSMDALLAALAPRPRARRVTWVAAAIAAAAIACGVIVALGVRRPAPDPCAGGAALTARVLDEGRASRIRQAFGATGAPWAPAAAERAIADLRAFCTRWTSAHRAACEATAVRHAQSPALLDARMHCLSRRLEVAASIAGGLERATPEVTLAAGEATAALPDLAPCDDAAGLGALEPRPAGPRAVALRDLEGRLAAARADGAAGVASEESLAAARALVVEADAIGYRPAIAEARLVAASALRRRGEIALAEREAGAALVAAEGGRDDRAAAAVWLELLAVRAERGGFAEVVASEAPATAAIARLGSPADLEAALRFLLGVARTNTGELDLARRDLDASLAARERLHGERHLDVTRTLTALGNLARVRGERARALELHERALGIDAELLGSEHPALARHHHNAGGVLRLEGRLAEARARYERALALEARGYGASSLAVGRTENSLGLVAIAERDWPAAQVRLERARVILASHPDRALALHNLGIVAAAGGRHHDAIRLYDEALAVHAAAHRDDAVVAGVRESR